MTSTLRPTRARSHPASARAIAQAAGAVVTGAVVTGADDPPGDVELTGVTLDSRHVQAGDLYAALPGAHAHGASYAASAAQAGAVAVLTDPAGERLLDGAGAALPRIVVPDPRAVLGEASAAIYGRAGDDLLLVGITGTNGKTTTAYILQAALHALGRKTGLIGTIEIRIGDVGVPAIRTTPESPDLHGLFAVMAEQGADSCVMEVSSHALTLHRVDGVRFDVAVFTNLSQDHLDFHATMEDYYAAKADLFTPGRARRGVICVDDQWGARLAREARIPVTTLATRADPAGPAGWRIISTDATEGGAPFAFDLVGPERTLHLTGALPGDFNRTNTALAALALLECGVSVPDVERALAAGATVPGRMERVDLGAGAPTVYVDFAHTPEAIRATLAALSSSRPGGLGRLIAVVGAGGNRDRGKRPLMGAEAAAGADVVVITDDNPRDEDPAAIRADVASGARWRDGTAVQVLDVEGREAAIAAALAMAAPEDIVAVLGRGHETKQEFMGTFRPFDDRCVAREAWAAVTRA